MPLKMYQKEEAPKQQIKYVIGVAAGKGGVGKSTVTVNLGHALKRLGYQVGIMDTDIYGPSMRKLLPEDRLPSQEGAAISPALCQGMPMISMAYFRKTDEAAAVRAPIANGVIMQFIKNVSWGMLDFLLIDFPPGTGDVQLTLCQHANLTGAVMVTTPQEVAVMDVRKAMHLFDQVKVPILGVVENMSYYTHPSTGEEVHIFGKGGGERLAREANVPYLGGIPLDPEVCRSGDAGRSLLASQSEAPAIQPFMHLAAQVAAQVQEISQGMGRFELAWQEMDKG